MPLGLGTYEGSLAAYHRMIERRSGAVFDAVYRRVDFPDEQDEIIQSVDDLDVEEQTVQVLPGVPDQEDEVQAGLVAEGFEIWWIGHDEFVTAYGSGFTVKVKADTLVKGGMLWQIEQSRRLISNAVWSLIVKSQGLAP